MAASVRLSQTVVARIKDVVPPVVEEVKEHLQNLAERPMLGTPIPSGDFEGTRAYGFRVNRLPATNVFTILYDYLPDEDLINVLDFCNLTGNPPVRKPAAFW